MLNAFKRSQLCCRRAYFKANFLAVACGFYYDPALQFRAPSQQNRVLAIIGLQLAKQIVLVLETSASKTLVVIISAAVASSSTTILIFPTVALQSNMLKRFYKVGI